MTRSASATERDDLTVTRVPVPELNAVLHHADNESAPRSVPGIAMSRPSLQFYPRDWRTDAELQACSLAAQGLWINAICVAHDCDPYGHLMVNSKPMTVAQIAKLVAGVSAKECKQLLDELELNGVCSKATTGAYYSRRMVRDEAFREQRADIGRANGYKGAEFGALGAHHGTKGGRPRVLKPPQKPPHEPPHTQGLKPPQEPPYKPPQEPGVKPPQEPG